MLALNDAQCLQLLFKWSGPYYGSLRPEFSVYILAPYDGMHSITLILESHKAIGHNLEKWLSSVIS